MLQCYLLAVLIHSSLVGSDVEHHLFTYLLAISLSPLEKCLFKSFAHFKIWLFDFGGGIELTFFFFIIKIYSQFTMLGLLKVAHFSLVRYIYSYIRLFPTLRLS